MRRRYWICIPDRYVCRRADDQARCPHCQQPLRMMGLNWCAPAKTDDKAWRWLAEHPNDQLWDRPRVARADHAVFRSGKPWFTRGVFVRRDRRLTRTERGLMPDRNGRRLPNGDPHYRPENGAQFSHTCGCGKRAYRTRKAARKAARRHDEQVRTYRCLTDTEVYHIGHLHKDVTAGKVSRGKVYRRDR